MYIHRCALEAIAKTVGSKPPETGGILVGPRNARRCTEFIFDKKGQGSERDYVPHVDSLNEMLDEAVEKGMSLRAFVHSHPDCLAHPSDQDIKYAQKIMAANPGMDEFWLVIVTGSKGRLVEGKTIHAWRCLSDGSVRKMPIVVCSPLKKKGITGRIHSSGNVEWYTPSKYIEPARRIMGVIDLDPASSLTANKTVKAKKIYTREDDGLAQDWSGRIWHNPPYGKRGSGFEVFRWIEKLDMHYRQGDVPEAFLLVNNVPDRNWFQVLWNYDLCFVRARIRFINGKTGEPQNSPTHGNVIAYFGPQSERFKDEYSQFGKIVLAS